MWTNSLTLWWFLERVQCVKASRLYSTWYSLTGWCLSAPTNRTNIELFEVLLDIVVQVTVSSSNMVDSNGFEPLRFLQNGFTVRRLQPLGQLSIYGGVSRVRTYTALGRLPGYSRMPFLSGVYSILVYTLRLCHHHLQFKVTVRRMYIKSH